MSSGLLLKSLLNAIPETLRLYEMCLAKSFLEKWCEINPRCEARVIHKRAEKIRFQSSVADSVAKRCSKSFSKGLF